MVVLTARGGRMSGPGWGRGDLRVVLGGLGGSCELSLGAGGGLVGGPRGMKEVL